MGRGVAFSPLFGSIEQILQQGVWKPPRQRDRIEGFRKLRKPVDFEEPPGFKFVLHYNRRHDSESDTFARKEPGAAAASSRHHPSAYVTMKSM